MNVHDQVAREALHDWLTNRPPREKPSPSEYLEPDELRAHRIAQNPDALRDQDRPGK
jgi:hypothetical protein